MWRLEAIACAATGAAVAAALTLAILTQQVSRRSRTLSDLPGTIAR
jgi:hypothetical protein